ncbi:MAG: helix-turn-helix transcriptional regulator [Clostridiales bacterium]|nr:helix-turn-helix transcriptional regulator [Clostridiales bacterium]
MNRTELKDASGVSFNIIAKMGRNEYVSVEILCKICITLDCVLGEIVELEKRRYRNERENTSYCTVSRFKKSIGTTNSSVYAK